MALHRKPGTDDGDGFVAPGRRLGKPLSGMSMTMLLRRMNAGVTVHGFRSSFRDWRGDATAFPREVAEGALTHIIGGTEAAYRRGDALEKRRALLQAWVDYCSGGVGTNVVLMT